MDTCSGTLSTSMSFLMLPLHRDFVSCDIDGYYIKEATPSLVLFFGKKELSPDWDIEGYDEVGMTSKFYFTVGGGNRVAEPSVFGGTY